MTKDRLTSPHLKSSRARQNQKLSQLNTFTKPITPINKFKLSRASGLKIEQEEGSRGGLKGSHGGRVRGGKGGFRGGSFVRGGLREVHTVHFFRENRSEGEEINNSERGCGRGRGGFKGGRPERTEGERGGLRVGRGCRRGERGGHGGRGRFEHQWQRPLTSVPVQVRTKIPGLCSQSNELRFRPVKK